jgi:hypothetical protein
MPVLKGIKSCLLVAMAAFVPKTFAATLAEIDVAHLKGLQWLLTNQDGEGGWPSASGVKIIATTSSLDSLAQAGIKGYPYSKGISWLANAGAASTDALARQALSLFNAGVNTSDLISSLIARRNENATSLNWGAYDHYDGSFPDTSLALDAIKITGTTYASVGNGISYITSKQNTTDGGWPYTKSEPATAQSRVIPTAYNVLTLNRYKASYSVSTNLNNAITWLKSQQKSGGGFGEGTNGTVLETALAYQAIAAEKGTSDPAAITAQDFLIAQQSTDGSWSNDAFTTAQVLRTFPVTVLPDADTDGVPDEIEALMGTDADVADSRWLAEGNGQSVPGETTPVDLVSGTVVNQPFSLNLAGAGTAPYTWKITSGSLPPGLSLNSTTGLISGTPTTVGSYSFEYTVTDATGASTKLIGQIDILLTAPASRDGDLNGDGVVDAADVAMAERIALGIVIPTSSQLARGDVAPTGGNGVMDAADVARIRRKALGLENC